MRKSNLKSHTRTRLTKAIKQVIKLALNTRCLGDQTIVAFVKRSHICPIGRRLDFAATSCHFFAHLTLQNPRKSIGDFVANVENASGHLIGVFFLNQPLVDSLRVLKGPKLKKFDLRSNCTKRHNSKYSI